MSRETRQIGEQKVIDLLTAVFTVCLLHPSLRNDKLEAIIPRARLAARRRINKMRPERRVIVDLDVLGHVVYLWQRRPEYLDDEGRPLALTAKGKAPSIEALFKEIKKKAYFAEGFRHLIRLSRIRRVSQNRYLPCSEVTIIDGLTPEMVNLLNLTINRLISTVLFNTSPRNQRAVRLIERVTVVPDLPGKHVRAFKNFAREQGGALINTTNEWLESHRGKRVARATKPGRHVTAGLHVFSFIEKGNN